MAFTFGYPGYTDDTGKSWSVKMRSDVAGVLGLLPMPNKPAHPMWPRAHKDLRHAWAKNANGQRIRRICITLADTVYQEGITSFTWTDGLTYGVEGIVGERRVLVG